MEQDKRIRPDAESENRLRRLWRQARGRIRRALVVIRRRVPPGARTVLGLLLIAGGMLGFLPVLGFWMIPLGVAVAALDLVPLWRWLTGGRDPGRRD